MNSSWPSTEASTYFACVGRTAAALAAIASFVALVAGLGAAGCSSSAAVLQEEVRPQAVRVVAVRQGPVVQGRRYLATVVSADAVRVLAQLPGTVIELPVAPGVVASRGQVLARIGAPELAARAARARAERSRAETQRDFACAHLATDRGLADAGVMTSEQLDTSETACAAAQLALDAAQAAGDEVGAASAKAVETAPFDGRVLDHFVDPGQAVMPGAPLLLFGTVERELLLRVPQEELDGGVGLGATVLFDGGRGEVSEIGGQARGPVGLVELRVAVLGSGAPATLGSRVETQPAPLPLVGATLSVRVVVAEQEHATSVPLDALAEDEQGTYVVLVADARAERFAVTPGPQDAGWIAVEPAPPTGSRVVVRAAGTVDVGAPVIAVEVGS